MPVNEFNQPIGESLPSHTPGDRPAAVLLPGRYCRLEKLSAARHGADLYAVYGPTSPLSTRPTAGRSAPWRCNARIPPTA